MPTPPIWLLAGTGEGPHLAGSLLARGWRLLVSVVGAEAARAYDPHPNLTLRSGALESEAALEAVLDQLHPRWVVDATHPFASTISHRLQRVCQRRGQPLLSLARPAVSPELAPGALQPLQQLSDLQHHDLAGERLLLAIGSRHLPAALAASPAAAHFARVLDRPGSLQLARAAGLPDSHLACLRPRPRGDGAVERALCRRWRITAVLCRQSGGAAEALWHRISADLGLRLLLLLQPPLAPGTRLPEAALLEKLGHP